MTTRRLAAAAAAAAVVLAGCGSTGADQRAVAASTSCRAEVRPPLQASGHLIGDTPPPVPYSSTPPTSGWHASGGIPPPGLYETQLPDPSIVAVLEQGGVVVAYAGSLDADGRAAADAAVTELGDVVVTPYALDDGGPPVVMLAWGVLQRCDEIDVAAVRAFADAHGGVALDH